jgi:hypothetical protein
MASNESKRKYDDKEDRVSRVTSKRRRSFGNYNDDDGDNNDDSDNDSSSLEEEVSSEEEYACDIPPLSRDGHNTHIHGPNKELLHEFLSYKRNT